MTTHHRTVDVDGIEIFCREAGDPARPTLLLLHGFPTAGHMFRDLIPRLADRFHLVAPDLPGFGQSAAPDRSTFNYTFDALARVIERFTEVIGLGRFALYVFDYGAPVGLRVALRRPEAISAIVTQNGNAYHEGLSEGWAPLQAYWEDPSEQNRNALRELLAPGFTRFQYIHGVPDASVVSPDGWALDNAYLARPGNDEIQLDLFRDYATNLAHYADFQRYLASRRPPVLAVWGRNDPFFLPAGAEAFRRDVPAAVVQLFDTGHFALETHAAPIADAIAGFLGKLSQER